METEYFNYLNIAEELNISEQQLSQLEEQVKKEFPFDQMMFELHMLRALESIKKGHWKLD